MEDYPRFPIWGNSLVNFKTEVCSKTVDSYLTMQWIKEVETAKSIDDHLTSQSTTGRRDFPDDDMLDANSKKCLLFHRMENSAKNTDILMSGSAVKSHG